MDVKAQIEAGLANIDQQVKAAIQAGNENNKQALDGLEDKIGTIAAQILDLEQKEGGKLKIDEAQSMGMDFVNSATFQAYASKQSTKASFEVQNAAITSSDAIVAPDRQAGIVGPGQRILRIEDLLFSENTSSGSVEYTRENVFTNAAAETAEGTAAGESAITFTLEVAPVATISHTIPMSQQVVEDAPMLKSYIDGRMSYGALLKKEAAILNGNGTGANMSGLLKAGNHTAFTAGVGSNALENIRKAMTLVELSEYAATGIVLNPADVEALDLDQGSDGHFRRDMASNPWGLPIIKSNSIPAGTFLLGDFTMGAGVWNRRGVTISMSDSDGSNFPAGLITLKADLRAALTVFRPASFVGGALTA